MVNRLWHHHFGVGIVATPGDFGRMGQKPTHPELLDWLSSEFVQSGWSMKHMHRLMVTSNTYRQSSAYREEAAQADPLNRLLWRFRPQRLEAEAIRDSALLGIRAAQSGDGRSKRCAAAAIWHAAARGRVDSVEESRRSAPSQHLHLCASNSSLSDVERFRYAGLA